MAISVNTALALYLEAKSHHDEARKTMARAERIFHRLRRTLADEDAYRLAGVSLADHRDIKAYQAKRAALSALVSALPKTLSPETVLIFGRVAVLEADLRTVANDRTANCRPVEAT